MTPPTGHQDRRRRRTSRLVLVALFLLAAGTSIAVTKPWSPTGAGRSGASTGAEPTGLRTVVRQDLSSQTQVPATLGYAGSSTVIDQAQGTVTWLPAVGQVVSQGQVLFQVSSMPVVLLYGSIPAYRTLSPGVDGPDVAQLNADLVATGDATSTELPAGAAAFTYWTEEGVSRLQAALGSTPTGTLALGQVVFEPGAVRVASLPAALGAPAEPGQPVLSATSTTRQVSIALDAAQQSEVAVGGKVTITLPDTTTTPGVISSVGSVAMAPPASGAGTSGSTSPTITVLVTPTDPAATGTWDQAPVDVTITTRAVSNALVVPVDALLATTGGRYAVEVVGAHGAHHLQTVALGLFDDADGLVQVRGPGLAVGQRVVVPKL